MIPGAFDYHRPTSVADAVKLLVDLGDDARVLAGGHSLIPMMKLRMAVPEALIDIRGIAGLKGISQDGGAIAIGAMTTQAELIASALLRERCPIIGETAAQIADPQVRNMGTIGGNVANGDPGNDMPALMQALDATFLVEGPGGAREVKARDFYKGAYETALADNEILTSIRFAAPAAGHGWAYEKQKRKIGDYATAAAAVILTVARRMCTGAAVALTNVADTPLFVAAAGAALVGTSLDADAVKAAAGACEAVASPSSDSRGPAEYRIKIAGVMVARAIARAADRAS
jgi:carbon-monoxide dehydrogenase medium subunit